MIKNVQIFYVDWNLNKHEGGGGVGGVLFKPWKSFLLRIMVAQ